MNGINIKTLAEKLNLSVSTVSKAFQGGYDISNATQERVLALAKKLNYQPNPHASNLRKKLSKTIAIVIPEIDNNFFTLAIKGIESIAQENGYHVLIYLTHEDFQKEISFTQFLLGGRVDGVLMSLTGGTKDYTHLDSILKTNIPIVFFDRVYEKKEVIKVTTNDYESSYNATKLLIDNGCSKIAHITLAKQLSITNQRKKGYIQALKDNNRPIIENCILNCKNNSTCDYGLIKDLLINQKPDGIFSSFESLAMTTYEACNDLSINIPNELKIISFSNLETAQYLNPSLSTVTQPAYEIGKKAASILISLMEKKHHRITNKHFTINAIINKRSSTIKI